MTKSPPPAATHLSREAAIHTAQSVPVGPADRARLDAVLPLLALDGRIRLSEVLGRLFPDMSRKDALTAFRQFRDRLRKAAGADLALDVDSGTRTDPAHRWCWFTGKDAAASAATQAVAAEVRAWEVSDAARIANAAVPLVEAETRSVVRKPQDAVAVRVEAIGKPVVRCFVSYAHADASSKTTCSSGSANSSATTAICGSSSGTTAASAQAAGGAPPSSRISNPATSGCC